jgi:hypothetical protein
MLWNVLSAQDLGEENYLQNVQHAGMLTGVIFHVLASIYFS